MHNLDTNFKKILEITKNVFADELNQNGNFKNYPRISKLSDAEVIALTISAEAIGLVSENFLFIKLKSDYIELFKKLPHRTTYNRRKRKLMDRIEQLSQKMSEQMTTNSTTCIVDSMPLPVCRTVRSKFLKILKDDDVLPELGYSAIDKQYYFGFKLHVLMSEYGVIISYFLTPSNVHDVKLLKDLTSGFVNNCTVIGDKGYLVKSGQLKLFEDEGISIVTPKRKNQKDQGTWTPLHRYKRKRIETAFSQFCDQLMIKRNYAKKFSGYFSRITIKIASFTLLQYINHLNNKPLNRIKHALAF